MGSGFLISKDGYILTNNHVISNSKEIFVKLKDEREFKAKIIGTDEQTDIALIKINIKNAYFLPIGDIEILKKGNWVIAIGSPFGLESTVTSGIISSINRDTGEYLKYIQTDAAVNPGNSGGPLLNVFGEVIGINSQIVSRNGGFMGISLSIPIDEAMKIKDQFIKYGKVKRSSIGVQIGEINEEVSKFIGLNKNQGALVINVKKNSPADIAKIQPGDVILFFNNTEIISWNELPRLIGSIIPNTVNKIGVWRKGQNISLKITVQEKNVDIIDYIENVYYDNHPKINNEFGISIIDISNKTKNKLRIKNGIKIKGISDTYTENKIYCNDIILSVNDIDVINVKQFNLILNSIKKKSFCLLIKRNKLVIWIAFQHDTNK